MQGIQAEKRQYTRARQLRATVWTSVVLMAFCLPGWSQRLIWLGTLGGGMSRAFGVSRDGRYVVGWSWDANTPTRTRAFRWDATTGRMEDLGDLGAGGTSEAYGVSDDGRYVVGRSEKPIWDPNAGRFIIWMRAFRWDATNRQMQDLGTLGGDTAEAYGISANGRYVVGFSSNENLFYRPFLWDANNPPMRDIGTPAGYANGRARAISPDGRYVAGDASLNQAWHAFWWDLQAGQQLDLGVPIGYTHSWAYGVSSNGRFVVGWAQDANGRNRAFRWDTQGGAPLRLDPFPGGTESWARAVTPDGRVFGVARNQNNQLRACRWSWNIQNNQVVIEDLTATYARLLGHPNSVLSIVTAVSPDGRYLVGYGYNAVRQQQEGFLLDTRPMGDVNGDNCVNDNDLLAVLLAYGCRACPIEDLNNDGVVDDADLLMVLLNFGAGC